MNSIINMAHALYESTPSKSHYVSYLLSLIEARYFSFDELNFQVTRKKKNTAIFYLINNFGTLDIHGNLIDYLPYVDFAFNYYSAWTKEGYKEIQEKASLNVIHGPTCPCLTCSQRYFESVRNSLK